MPGDDLVLGAAGVGHIVGQVDLEPCGLTHQAALEHRLVVAGAVAHKALVLQQQAVIPGGYHHPAAVHRHVALTELDAQVHQVVVGVGAGGG